MAEDKKNKEMENKANAPVENGENKAGTADSANNTKEVQAKSTSAKSAKPRRRPTTKSDDNKGSGPKKRIFKRKAKRLASRKKKEKPEFDQKIVDMARVTRVVAGGRRFSFRVTIVIGDKNGRVGIGIGKSTDTTVAIQKAINDAKKNIVKLGLNSDMSIPYTVEAKYSSAIVNLRPNYGRGLVAGSVVRTVLELAGARDITTKIMSRSKNKINNARATIKALEDFIVERGEKVLAASNNAKDKNTANSETKEKVAAGVANKE